MKKQHVACNSDCHQVLQPYDQTECNATTQSLVNRINLVTIYIIPHTHCLFNYSHLHRQEISVNLYLPDAQSVHLWNL